MCYVLLVGAVTAGGSADGGKDEKMFDCQCFIVDCNQTNQLLKGYVTSLYCIGLK
jgi:hypothetical protein